MSDYTGPSFTVHVTYTVPPENVDKFLEALKPGHDDLTAEPRCTFFEVYLSHEQGHAKISFVESWNASIEWFANVQMKKDHYQTYFAAIEPLQVEGKPREATVWEPMPGKEWVMQKKDMDI